MSRLSLHMGPCRRTSWRCCPTPTAQRSRWPQSTQQTSTGPPFLTPAGQCQGGFPLFMDRRVQQAKDSDAFPSSWQIKTFCYEFLKGCLHNPALTDEETATIILDPTQPPPSDPNGVIQALCAPLKAEALPDGVPSAEQTNTPSSVRGPEVSSGSHLRLIKINLKNPHVLFFK